MKLTENDIKVGATVGVLNSRASTINTAEIVRLTKTQIVVKFPSGVERKFRRSDFTEINGTELSRWSRNRLTTLAHYNMLVGDQQKRTEKMVAWNALQTASQRQDIEAARAAMAKLEELNKA